jgi:hypothetical protein
VETRVAEQRAAKRAADSVARGATNAKATPAPAPAQLSAEAQKKALDSMRAEITHEVFDSLARMQQAQAQPPRGPGGGRGQGRGDPGANPTRVFIDRGGAQAPRPGIAFGPELDSLIRSANAARNFAGGRGGGPSSGLEPADFEKRAASMGPQRRVVVTEPRITNRALTDAAPFATLIGDSLRATIGRSKRFVVVNPDTVRAALDKTRTIDDLAPALTADMFVNIAAYRAGGDSVTWTVTARDLTANGAYYLRSWTSKPLPVHGASIAPLDSLIALTAVELASMDKAPRKRPPDTAPGGPLAKEAFDARAANMGPTRRLIVWTHPPDRAHPEIEAAGNSLMEFLRKGLSGNSRYSLVSSDETLNTLAKTRTRDEVAAQTHADMMVTVRGAASKQDSVVWSVIVWDLTAYGPYEQRPVGAGRAAIAGSPAVADSLLRAVSATLQTLDRAPRKTP